MLKWFHGLKIAHKLTLVSVIFVIPDSIMLYLFITSINENIQFARLEQTGNQYQRAVEPLLKLIPEHRLLTRSDIGDRDEAKLKQVRNGIDSALVELTKTDRRIGETLDFTPSGLAKRNRDGCDVANLRASWEWLRKATDGPETDTTDRQHLAIINNVREMIAHAGDNSNLILDPELDSYYLMDVTLMALPRTQDRMTQIMVDGVKRLYTTGPAEHERETLAIDLAMLREDYNRVHESIKTTLTNGNPAYGYNASLHGRLPPLLAKYSDATNRFCDLLKRMKVSTPDSTTQAEFLAAGQAARDASFEFWNVCVEELDGLLQKRIDHYTFRRTFSLGISACALMAAACFVTFITRSISGPLKKQAEDLKASLLATEAERKIAEARLVLQQKAEADLRAAQDQLVTASRQAGMAEVATGVLHNVGNVLTSVNVSVHQIKDAVQASPVNKLTRAAEMIDAHESDLGTYLTADPRGKFIPGYVSELAKMLGQENAAMLTEVENLVRGVDHIKQVVQFQQNYAKPSTVFEVMNPADLLEDALRLNLIALDRHGVTIERHVDDIGPVKIDKHKTLQILVNLISNAKNAMCDLNGNAERRLTLGMKAVEADGEQRLRISVQDNGVGIAPENLALIFAHGFTTRKDGHGFGLHSAANSAREMNGTLEVFSAGPNQGATFTLDIPAQPHEVMA